MKKKIAIIGSGISGITAGYELSKKYEIHIYEKNSYLGGHTHTHEITENNNERSVLARPLPVDKVAPKP